jgi:antitoxin PrlF
MGNAFALPCFGEVKENQMLAELKVESTLTDKYQTTMPGVVRKALGLKKRDRISYTILPEGDVLLSRVSDVVEDPAIGAFLSFLAQDISRNPGHIRGLDAPLRAKLTELVDGVELDLDAALSPEDE